MSQPKEHPRRPRLTVRVGVTGHRKEDLAEADEGKLRESIRAALEEIRRVAEEIHRQAGPLYTADKPLLRLLSSLAEGTDQIVADEAVGLGFELHCPLPFAREAYTEKFDEASKARFNRLLSEARAVLDLNGCPEEKERPAAYLAAGRVILHQCDVLLAVWDGNPPKGIGGTGQMVEEAATLEIPTIWIGSKPPHLADLRTPKAASEETTQDLSCLGERLKGSLLPSDEPFSQHRSLGFRLRAWILSRFKKSLPRSERDRALAFFGETPPRKLLWPGLIFSVYRFIWAGKKEPFEEPSAAWLDFVKLRPRLGERVENCYGRHFSWADNLANACVSRYRDSLVAGYLLGALAVCFALSGLHAAHAYPERAHEAGVRWFGVELVLILIILLITNLGWFRRWHERWMDYRPLAEALRQMRFLDPLARVPSSFKVPAHLGAGDPRRSWFNWYFRALVREAGMIGERPPREPILDGSPREDHPTLVLDSEYLVDFKRVLAEAIEGQIRYHRDNHKIFHRLHHNSHIASQIAFGLAALGCILHFYHFKDPAVEVGLSYLAIVAPGFGAAFSAMLFQGEFERTALRSQTIEKHLEQLAGRLKTAKPTYQALGQIAGEFSDLIMNELVDWRFVFVGKDLTLPA